MRQIVEHFGLGPFFTEIVGATFDGRISSKSSVVAEVLRRLGMETEREAVTLVGDTRFDVEGAREENVGCVAVSYGYGTRQELEAARAPRILDSVAAVERYFLERIR